MRKALNDNPIVQVAILGVLALVVGFLLITKVAHRSSTASSATTTSAASVAPGTAPGAATSAPSTPSATTPPGATPEASAGGAAPAAGAPVSAAAAGRFAPGPGLPAPIVKAYAQNKAVVLLVVRRDGIDDDAVKSSVERMAGSPDVALFVTNAGHVSRYSRIATGVDLNRVPALIVLRPRKLTRGAPVATVSYGFRGTDSVAQAIHDALYEGPTDLPYYPK